MIAYDLECSQGHIFEGWFENSDSFNEQLERGLIDCPVCGSSKISRRLSTFGIARKSREPQTEQESRMNVLENLVTYINDNFTDVGADFAKEALKMHYGVAEHRNIRGVSSAEEEKTLREEGIPFFKIPGIADANQEDD